MRAGERREGIHPLLLAAPLSVVVAAIIFVLGMTQPPGAEAVVAVLAAVLPAACAAVLWLPLGSRRTGRLPAYQQWFAGALALAALVQLLQAVGAVRGPPAVDSPFPEAVEILAPLVAPLAMAGLVTFARTVPGLTGAGLPAARILLDALLLAVAFALLIWRFGFQDRSTAGTAASILAVASLYAPLAVACMAGLLALRRPERHLLAAAAGVGAVVLGHIIALAHVFPWDVGRSWPGEALVAAGWPLIAAGVLTYRPSAVRLRDDPPVEYDARLSAVTATATAFVLVVGVLAILVRPPVDRVSLGLVLVLIVAVWVREMLTTEQRSSLVRRLHAEATLDPLTGLANRRSLTQQLSRVRPGDRWCVLTLDLDAFKTVNDVIGHGTGDRLLQAVAERLREVVKPPRAVVARVGGDEFAVLLRADHDETQRLAEALIAAVGRACEDVPGVDRVAVSACVGIADVPAPGAGSDPLSALSAAGAAQQLAKAAGRDRVRFFDDDVARLRRRRLTVEERLRRAVSRGEIKVHYQPIVALDTGRLAGVEALARWTDAELGPVEPEEFISVAEASGLVVPLGELVLDEAIRQAVEAGLPAANVRLSCNVSPLQLRVPGFHRLVEGALAAHAMPPSSLVVEVTEATLVEEAGVAVRTLRMLDELGVLIAIDDFGTGYSALGYLRRLPARILKIDRSLTASLNEEPRAHAITEHVTALGKEIGLMVVVEGIESREVSDLVHRMGADFGQGSLFGRPTPLNEVPGLCAASPRMPHARIRTAGDSATSPAPRRRT